LDLTIKNIRFPPQLNNSISAALELPQSPGSRQSTSLLDALPPPVIDSSKIESKVQAVMRAVGGRRKKTGAAKALGLSVEGSLRGSSTMFSPEPSTREEEQARQIRRGMMARERETERATEARAMEERQRAFNMVFGRTAKVENKVVPPPPPPHVPPPHVPPPHVPPVAVSAHHFDELDEFDPPPSSSTLNMNRRKELQDMLPGSTFGGGGKIVIDVVAEGGGGAAPPTVQGFRDRSGVLVMSPGGVSMGQRQSNFDVLRAKKVREMERRQEERREERGGEARREEARWEERRDEREVKREFRKLTPPQLLKKEEKFEAEAERGAANSNARAIRNAIANLCLAGHHMAAEREGALGALDMACKKVQQPRFIILLSKGGSSLAYKGLYLVSDDRAAVKMLGWGPKVLVSGANICGSFYRFNTSKKSFEEVGSSSFGGTVDAVCVDGAHVKIKKRDF